jgi:hypothetical protein
MTTWTAVSFPHVAMPGDYLRVDDGRFIVLEESDGSVRFDSYDELRKFVEEKLR